MALFAVPAEAQEPGAPVSAADLISGAPHPLPIAGKVTMVDIGAHSCIPCKMMTPIIEELSREYDGRAVIAFIDVWEHREVAPEYGVTAIPTQIFYDAQGKERYRHVGYLDKQSIVARLAELGVR
ncbi:thioredoxin family protein [Pseudodesulfovibrio karagichevae]|uniref:Thioredoxin family protein n=1 Tax=Pseudodesulfovibrio karagichevae TaxID=3239305 RepID=A0ABV4K1V3_9BACT